MDRNREIIRTSWLGIAANFFLSVFKLIVGHASCSVSIIADGINNFTDAMSSAITIIGMKLSGKEPDRKHPFGYGRVEYLTSLFIGVIILYAGFDSIKNSIARIIQPEPNEYSSATLIVVSVAVIVKILLGLYTKSRGKAMDSEALTASGKDALNDSIASAATLAAAIIYIKTGAAIESWVGVGISLIVIKTGLDTLKETADYLIGKSTDIEIANQVKKSILSFPEIEDVCDIVVHSYGKNRLLGSAHIEVSDRYKVAWVDNLQRAIERKVRADTGVDMLGVSVCAINTHSPAVAEIRENIRKVISETDGARSMHSFYIDVVDKTMNFDVVMEFDAGSRTEFRDKLLQKISGIYEDYDIKIAVDYDFTES